MPQSPRVCIRFPSSVKFLTLQHCRGSQRQSLTQTAHAIGTSGFCVGAGTHVIVPVCGATCGHDSHADVATPGHDADFADRRRASGEHGVKQLRVPGARGSWPCSTPSSSIGSKKRGSRSLIASAFLGPCSRGSLTVCFTAHQLTTVYQYCTADCRRYPLYCNIQCALPLHRKIFGSVNFR